MLGGEVCRLIQEIGLFVRGGGAVLAGGAKNAFVLANLGAYAE